MEKTQIAKKLKLLRETAGLTQKQVGDKVGKAYQTVASWESGKGQPDAGTFMFLCKLYKVDCVLSAFGYVDNDRKKEPAALTPSARCIGRAYERAALPVQRTVEVALEPYMDETSAQKGRCKI